MDGANATMELEAARGMAEQMMEEHGLSDWTLVFDRAKSRLGSARYGKKQITLSKFLTPLMTPHEVSQTMLHEIAHALTQSTKPHDKAWQLKAAEIGYQGGVKSTLEKSILAYSQRAEAWRKRHGDESGEHPPLRVGAQLLLDGEIHRVDQIHRVNVISTLLTGSRSDGSIKQFRIPKRIAEASVIG